MKKRQNNRLKLLISVDSYFKECFLFIILSFQRVLTNQTLTSLSLFKPPILKTFTFYENLSNNY